MAHLPFASTSPTASRSRPPATSRPPRERLPFSLPHPLPRREVESEIQILSSMTIRRPRLDSLAGVRPLVEELIPSWTLYDLLRSDPGRSPDCLPALHSIESPVIHRDVESAPHRPPLQRLPWRLWARHPLLFRRRRGPSASSTPATSPRRISAPRPVSSASASSSSRSRAAVWPWRFPF